MDNSDLSNCDSSDSVSEMFCELCKKDNKNVSAEGFCVECCIYCCAECLRHHGKFLSYHTVKNKATMPQDSCTEPCEIHEDEIIKFFCCNCDLLACPVCKAEKHDNCLSLRFIPSFVNEFDQRLECQTLMSSIKDDVKNVEKYLQSVKERKVDTEIRYNKAVKSLNNQRKEIDKELDVFEKEITHVLRKNRDEDSKELDGIITRLCSSKTKIELSMLKINRAKELEQKSQLFTSIKSAKQTIQKLETEIFEEKRVFRNYEYHPNIELLRMLKQTDFIGFLEVDFEQTDMTPKKSKNTANLASGGYVAKLTKSNLLTDTNTDITDIDNGSFKSINNNQETETQKVYPDNRISHNIQKIERDKEYPTDNQDIIDRSVSEQDTSNRFYTKDIAVTGLAGTGVSTFIDSIGGIISTKHQYTDSAIKKVKNEMCPYAFKDKPNITLWDIPHVDNITEQREDYFKIISADVFTLVIVLTSKRITNDDIWLATQLELRGKEIFLVRTKFGCDLRNEGKRRKLKSPLNADEIELMKKSIKEDYYRCVSHLICRESIFVIDSVEKDQFDFKVLQEKILSK